MVCLHESIREFFTGGIFWFNFDYSVDGNKEVIKAYRDNHFIQVPEENNQPCEIPKKSIKLPNLIILENLQTSKQLNLILERSSSELSKWLIITPYQGIFMTHARYNGISLNFMSREELITVLQYLFRNEISIDSSRLEKLSDVLYNWPILLGITLLKIQSFIQDAKNLKSPPSAEDILDRIINDIKSLGLDEFDNEKIIRKSVEKSLRSLSNEEQERFQSLFIFPSNFDIPLLVMEDMWNIPLTDVRNLCTKLAKLSLLKKFDFMREFIQTDSYLRRYFQSNKQINKKLYQYNKKFVKHYITKYNLESPEDLPDTIPSSIKTFFRYKKLFKLQWKKAEKKITNIT